MDEKKIEKAASLYAEKYRWEVAIKNYIQIVKVAITILNKETEKIDGIINKNKKMEKNIVVKKFTVEFKMTPDNKSVRFYNPSADEISIQLFSAILKALEQVEKEYNGIM